MGFLIGSLAAAVGAPEPALRLLISILVGYPLALVYHNFMYKQSTTIRHIYFAISGFLLIVFNYGFDVYHSLIAILFTYVIANVLYAKPKHLVIINFIFHMAYLLLAYYFTESDEYDIIWTMPHCVLVLRLIGLGFSIADGLKKPESLSKDQKESALTRIPSLLEITAYTYFPACCLVGPQFPFRRYERFMNKEFERYKGHVRSGLTRFGLGIFYLAIRQIGAGFLPDEYFLEEEFQAYVWWHKYILLAIWGKLALYKYVSCWLLAEGAATCFGLSFVGIKEDGSEDWSACSNIKLEMFEKASKLGHYVLSFNVNTNHWVAENVYKRLKFLNNRTISYASALFFLALWHGFHTGYYMSFFMEYLTITFERQISNIYDGLANGPKGNLVKSTPSQVVIFILRQIYTLVGMGWCLVPFVFLSYDKWFSVYKTFNYIGFVLLVPWFLGHFIYNQFFRPPKKNVKSGGETRAPSSKVATD
ncbi:unnamed protein product [Hermetia illucens]|uniref:Lysophospholipid acyltransferase 5 n=1 Tax=Hermetia illucens TaxID=343691 RepID=A0A7R8V8K5_HERIL|nr:lysophospholipid acyltransferase 5 [Hermetia illucens]XP_037925737.1 lysophospholipid acyltransferase 5 [Hermetia illucens]XP_037925738.1 lysophospholipid acyltransferase 5 [Hermetia illucens]XP_037925739.1 lysophospholipid acyltransferase 5 [Hermetia illucens]XP_037925740.1 lysophospholipid acyltransferase 5 [Hermetia illucens]XP_037925741.1 lysophospholipid acyltransferase 5 [Hermetia illucens]CAD7094133.1 unnamed protein product [Hermetia illucens]